MTGAANLELVRSIYAAWGRGDFSSTDWAHPEIEFVRIDGPDPGTWTGRDGLAAAHRDRISYWDSFRVEAQAIRELDDERVLVLVRPRGRGKTSGVELNQLRARAVNLFHVHAGKVTRIVVYFDLDRGLADLGLPPEAGSE